MTAGIDQLSLNLSATRSPGFSILASILLWPPGGLGGRITAGGFFFLTGCLEVARGIAQCGGPALAALGGLCEGGSLLAEVTGTSVGSAAGLNVTVGPAECPPLHRSVPSQPPTLLYQGGEISRPAPPLAEVAAAS